MPERLCFMEMVQWLQHVQDMQATWGWALSCSTMTALMIMLGCFLVIVE